MKVKLSGNLRRFVDFQRELHIDVPGDSTVNNTVQQLVAAFPGLRDVIYDSRGNIKQGYLICYNGTKVESGERDRPVSAQGCIDIFTGVAGG
jgi:molybdopterin synthase sulfur carrier subunit